MRGNTINTIVLEHLGVADAVARRYAGQSHDWSDLRQVACVGLVKAARRYDPGRGVDFVSYAVPTISGEIKRYLRDNGWVIRPPRQVQDLRTTMTAAVPRLAQSLGREPTVRELADALGQTVAAVTEAARSHECLRPVSLDAPVTDDAATLGESVGSSDPGLERAELLAALRAACRCLSPRDRRILYLRFFEDQTQQQIADELGVTQMQVSRLLAAIMRKLRAQLAPAADGPVPGRTAGAQPVAAA